MELEEFKNVAKTINVLFGNGTKAFFDTKEKVIGWHECLQDLDYAVVSAAVKNLAMRDSKFPPAISDIRKECAALTTKPSMTEQEAWAIVRDGIRNGIYGSQEEFDRFPSDVQRAVVNASALSDWAMLPSEDIDTVVAALFKRQYRSVIERKQSDAVIGRIGAQAGAFAAIAEETAKRLETHYESESV